MKSLNADKTSMATVRNVRSMTESTAVVRFDRCGIVFNAGQYVSVGLEGGSENREYSIYSGPNDDHVEILVKSVQNGIVSPHLCSVKPGDALRIAGPYGHFTINDDDLDKPFAFIATGTGIAPFRSLTTAHPRLDYQLMHGVRLRHDQYDRDEYGDHYTGCISRESGGDFHGRVTDHVATQSFDPKTVCYLCGNCEMIYDVFAILVKKGLNPDNLHAEIYY